MQKFTTKSHFGSKFKNFKGPIWWTNNDQSVDSDKKSCKKIRKLRTEQDKDYATESLLVIKNHYKLIAIDPSRPKEIDVNPKAIAEQLNNVDVVTADAAQSVFVLTILEKNKRSKTKIISRECSSFIKDG